MTLIKSVNHAGWEVQILKPPPIGWVNALRIKVFSTPEEAAKAMAFFFGDDKSNEYRVYESLEEPQQKEQ